MIERLGLRLRIFLFFAALAAGTAAAIAGGLWLGYARLGDPAALPGFVQAGAVAGFAALGLVAWIWFLFDLNVARAIDGIAGTIRARAHAEISGALDTAPARYLGDLAPAAAAVTETLAETRSALAEAVARETTRLSEEKARLEALLSDVPVGVLLCSAAHQLVFYNGVAVDLLAAGHAPGLDRTLFDYLREGPVRHAHARLSEAGEPDLAADLLCATVTGSRLLAGRMRLLDRIGPEAAPGYVLTLRDVTADMAAHAAREALLDEVFDRVRRPAANLLTLIGVQNDGGADDPALRGALVQEAATLAGAVSDLAERHDATRTDAWPLAPTRASDLFDGLRARAEAGGAAFDCTGPALILRCDGFALVALLGGLMDWLAPTCGAHDFRLDLTDEPGPGALLTLSWEGGATGVGPLDRWLDGPLEVGQADVTGRAVLARHGTEIWPETRDGRAALCLPIREARVAGRRPPPVPRAVVYDFDLLSKARAEQVAEARLSDLTYVVFDTETTGLAPETDEIVQIAAVRVVNGRIVAGEVFDTLVDPGRTIPPGSTEVHGITDAMVAGAPGIAEVGARFHRFAEGAVLIAHNAPFDMAFLRRHEAAIGARFGNPILDTVLLSAVVFGQHETHTLDALTHRLGIGIAEEARHTAIGDTMATAEAFLKLVAMLEGRGLLTFGAVLDEVRRHGRLLKDLN